jgi:hypothetical protein
MAKFAPDATLDEMLDRIATSTQMIACSSQPTTFTEATSTFALADVTMAGGDFTKANGDVSGRKLTVAAKSAVPVDTSGSATHVALVTVTGSVLQYVTTCTSQALTSGNTVNFPAWDIEVEDPA